MYQWEANRKSGAAGKKSSVSKSATTFHSSDSFPTDFNSLPNGMLQSATVDQLKTLGFNSLLPTQARCYSHIFKGSDTVLHARTGTGKTLGFLLPLIERQIGDVERQKQPRLGPWLTVLVPTIELAAQIQRVIQDVYPVGKDGGSLVRCGVAGLEISSHIQLPQCDVLVGTLGAVDKVCRLRLEQGGVLKEQGSSSLYHAKRSATHHFPAEGDGSGSESDDDDDDDEDLESDDENLYEDKDIDDEDEYDEQDLEEFESGNNNKSNSRRRGRDGNNNNNQNKNTNTKARDTKQKQQQVSPQNSANSKKPQYQKKRFAAAPGARFVSAIVIDEVDHTLGPKFSRAARRIHSLLRVLRSGKNTTNESNDSSSSATTQNVPKNMQCVLVGATIPDWIQRVGFLGDPAHRVTYRLVSAGTSKLPSGLKCFLYECSREQKERVATACQVLQYLVAMKKRVVVFAPTRLVEAIYDAWRGISSSEHGSTMRKLDSQADDLERLKVINEFNDGVANILVCTDRACRGLDFTEIDTVLCTSFPAAAPTAAETFVHRAGRAGRVGRPGNCITFLDSNNQGEVSSKRMIESSVHIAFKHFEMPKISSTSTNSNNNSLPPSPRQGPTAASSAAASSAAASTKKTTTTTSSSVTNQQTVTCRLKVRNAFGAGNKNKQQQTKTRSARDVLVAGVDSEMLKKIQIVNNNEQQQEFVLFKIPRTLVEEVKQALWKYDISIVN